MRLVRTPASHTSLASLSRSFVDAASLWDNKQEIPSDLYEMFYEILHSWNKQVLRCVPSKTDLLHVSSERFGLSLNLVYLSPLDIFPAQNPRLHRT